MVSSNYSYLIKIICLHTAMWNTNQHILSLTDRAKYLLWLYNFPLEIISS